MESTTKIVINRELKFHENDDTRDLLILCRDDSFHVFPRATADAANGIEWTDNIADLTDESQRCPIFNNNCKSWFEIF